MIRGPSSSERSLRNPEPPENVLAKKTALEGARPVSPNRGKLKKMKCPVCDVELNLSERHGVEIDYCPKCRGVWLDRGELDKIIERSAGEFEDRGYREEKGFRSREPERSYDDDEPRRRHPGKRRSFLGDLFDFD